MIRSLAIIGVLLCWAHPSTARAQASSEPPEQHEPQSDSSAITLRAFGAVQWGATDQPDVPSSFTLGQFAIFLTSNLSERVSVLAEIVLEGGTETEVVTDLERLHLTFRFDDHLQITAGRYHTGIGFYNTAFHHGAYFETPIGRPRAFLFEDEGGILPVHDVGVSVRGAVPGTGLGLHYLAEVGNGRRWMSSADNAGEADAESEEESPRDGNAAKALNLGLAYRPSAVRGLEIGGSYYRDTIARSPGPDVPHRIEAVYAVYRTSTTELMAEWLRLTHDNGVEFANHAGYAQAARSFGPLKPYYRYDRLSLDPETPFLAAIGDFTRHTAGLRFDPAEWVGLKAQYERTDQAGRRGIDAVQTQLVFVF
ncbi:MAG TPA: hypothetical protein VK886_19100 [Vicinamibacterales bacterium]|nr:hypothetical protein [Vicinamibacterales bacterium]